MGLDSLKERETTPPPEKVFESYIPGLELLNSKMRPVIIRVVPSVQDPLHSIPDFLLLPRFLSLTLMSDSASDLSPWNLLFFLFLPTFNFTICQRIMALSYVGKPKDTTH